ncbi:hypothetical protein CVT26_012888 [Gymnopilus dilepis]|uniref:Uncharacterized protein n=1 Tax=Gymnopilus dilepis TaxID=231916 RepID=A0A409YNT0_9AGAR|nr:hypothetical protein CVT26_012888 [Gymnopilus dilepis]
MNLFDNECRTTLTDEVNVIRKRDSINSKQDVGLMNAKLKQTWNKLQENKKGSQDNTSALRESEAKDIVYTEPERVVISSYDEDNRPILPAVDEHAIRGVEPDRICQAHRARARSQANTGRHQEPEQPSIDVSRCHFQLFADLQASGANATPLPDNAATTPSPSILPSESELIVSPPTSPPWGDYCDLCRAATRFNKHGHLAVVHSLSKQHFTLSPFQFIVTNAPRRLLASRPDVTVPQDAAVTNKAVDVDAVNGNDSSRGIKRNEGAKAKQKANITNILIVAF